MAEYEPGPRGLWEAAKSGDTELVFKLILAHSHHDYINFKNKEHGTTPLAVALKWSFICDNPRDYDGRRKKNHTDRHLAVVKLLLDYGADVSAICKGNTTALHYAIKYAPSNEYMKILIESGQDIQVNVKIDGKTPLLYAMSNWCGTDILSWEEQISLLIQEHADVNTLDGKGNNSTPDLQSQCMVIEGIYSPRFQN